jgi:hypothetical protein
MRTDYADQLALGKVEISLVKQNQGGIWTKSQGFGIIVIAEK